MKKLTNAILVAFLIATIFSSCKKNDYTTQDDSQVTMSTLKVSNTFNWSTGTVCELKVIGAVSASPVKTVMYVSESNGSRILSYFHKSDESVNFQLIIPRGDQKLVVKYGKSSFDVNIIGGTATFNLPVALALNKGNNNQNLDGVMADSDSDGVEDAEDAYPNDPYRAFNSFYPASKGTLAFEDLWPALGDFDYNDLVINYQMKTVTNADNNVVELVGDFDLVASGASFHDGFGIQFDNVAPNKVTEVIGNKFATTPALNHYTYLRAANGLESGQTYATNIVFDCFKRVMGELDGVNTNPDSIVVAPVNLIDSIRFLKNGVAPAGGTLAISSLPSTCFNFFIVTEKVYDTVVPAPGDTIYKHQQDRGREIHLRGFHPTSLANSAYFMTHADSTTGTNYYSTNHGLPWGLNLTAAIFEYPKEKAAIGQIRPHGTEAYHHFIAWAESNGVSYSTWYTRTAGNRADSLIYAKYHPGY